MKSVNGESVRIINQCKCCCGVFVRCRYPTILTLVSIQKQTTNNRQTNKKKTNKQTNQCIPTDRSSKHKQTYKQTNKQTKVVINNQAANKIQQKTKATITIIKQPTTATTTTKQQKTKACCIVAGLVASSGSQTMESAPRTMSASFTWLFLVCCCL
jgi:cobalamin biosynthesis Mg chelatase CobN